MPQIARSILLTRAAAPTASRVLGTTCAWIFGSKPKVGVLYGALIGGLVAALELFFVERRKGAFLRSLRQPELLSIMKMFWMGINTSGQS